MSYLHVAAAQPRAGFEDVPAFAPGLSTLGQTPAPPRLSRGQFGLAMSRVAIPNDAIRLLRLSATFRRMAQVLDKAYLDARHFSALAERQARRWRSSRTWSHPLTLDNNLRVVNGGGWNGRRILYVGRDDAGSLFIPGESIESHRGWDLILFNSSLFHGHTTIPWVESVAHETAHAFARVGATGTGATTAEQRVQAAVLDECTTRKLEQKVVTEVRATPAGRAALAGHTLRSVRTCDCERDWFPAAQKRTYLEHFVLGMDLESAARDLTTADVDKITADVAAIPLKFSTKQQPPSMPVAILRGTAQVGSFAKRFPVLKSATGQAAFVLRLVDASWRQLIAKVGEGSPTWTGSAQQLQLERHARLFFKIKVGYAKCPSKEHDHVSIRRFRFRSAQEMGASPAT